MSLPSFSIKRPILITSMVLILITAGLLSIKKLGIDMYPDVELPFVIVTTSYPGAGPEEIEEQISRPIEDEISSIAGLKSVHSNNLEGVSFVWGEFSLDSDPKYCEQQVRNKITKIRPTLPEGIEEPSIERWDMARDPIVDIVLMADMSDAKLYDFAKDKIKPMLEQVSDVGTVAIHGGTKREIQVELDRNKLNEYKIPATAVAERLKMSGLNVPAGKHEKGSEEMLVRSIGRYESVREIVDSVILFSGDFNNSVQLKSLGNVRDGTEDKTMSAYFHDPAVSKNTLPCIFLGVHKQSGTNTIKVVDGVYKRLEKINAEIAGMPGKPQLIAIHDGAKYIKLNVDDVKITIYLGVLLAVVIVYLFLGSFRSTLITGIAIPNSLLGGFVLMLIMGFTINIMTLLALTLTVGLLIDDAIVVRENIFRKIEHGMSSDEASEKGTSEVMMAVIATTITIIAVFFPIAFMEGIVGRFFKQFGLTVVFVMLISLFDAVTVAPFLSTYFSGRPRQKKNIVISAFDKLQNLFEKTYSRVIKIALHHPGIIVSISVLVFIISLCSLFFVQTTFMPQPDDKEFKVNFELPVGTSLEGSAELVKKIEPILQSMSEVAKYSVTVGDDNNNKSNVANFIVILVPEKQRKAGNAEIKARLRTRLSRDFAYAKPMIAEYVTTGDPFPFAVNIYGENLTEMESYSKLLLSKLQTISEITDIKSGYEGGKPEYQIVLNKNKMAQLGITPGMAGSELRTHIAGEKIGKLYDGGNEYDVRVRLKKDQRDIRLGYIETKIPNINNMMVPLSAISTLEKKTAPDKITRQDRRRIIQITANLAPDGALGTAAKKFEKLLKGEAKPPVGVSAKLIGQNEDMTELMLNIVFAVILSIIIIYLVLSSLYESFITPFTIMLALPPALSGAFLSLAITGKTLDIFSMIGLVMLLGIVAKNSILLVDVAVKEVRAGTDRKDAIYKAGQARLRPILMTTFAMLAGMFPVALGIGEASKGRMSMGIAIMGGVILSTLLSLIVVPAMFSYIDRLREKIEKPFSLETIRAKFGIGKRKKDQ